MCVCVCVVWEGGGVGKWVKASSKSTNLTLGPDAILITEIYKNSVQIMASMNHS